MASVLDIPEIAALICGLLKRRDLARLSRVSRGLFSYVMPLVWRDVSSWWDTPRILLNLLPGVSLHNRYYEEIPPEVKNLQHLDRESLSRFDLYTSHIRYIYRNFAHGHEDEWWDCLLRAVPRHPLLPNLQKFEFCFYAETGGSAEPIERIIPYLSHSLLEINSRRGWIDLGPRFGAFLASMIAQHSTNIHTLRLFTDPYNNIDYELRQRISVPSHLATSLEQLRNLQVLGLGPEALESHIFATLSDLPHLASLAIDEVHSVPWPDVQDIVALTSHGFPVIQHLAISCGSNHAEAVSRLWAIPSLTQKLVSVSITLCGVVPADHDHGIQNALCIVFQRSQLITDLYLNIRFYGPLPGGGVGDERSSAFFSRALYLCLGELPLRRVRIMAPGRVGSDRILGFDCKAFARALRGVEYFRLRGHCFSFEDLREIAKHMPSLRLLGVAIDVSTWPPAGQSSLGSSESSPSKLRFDIAEWCKPHAMKLKDSNNAETVAAGLDQLWPEGVRCEAIPADVVKEDGRNLCTWVDQVNMAIEGLRSQRGSSVVRIKHVSPEWKYMNERSAPSLYEYDYDYSL